MSNPGKINSSATAPTAVNSAIDGFVAAIKRATMSVASSGKYGATAGGGGGGGAAAASGAGLSGGSGGGGAAGGAAGGAMKSPSPPSQGWKLVRDMVADTVGPMAILAIAANKFVTASAGAALNAQKMQEALAASDGAEKMKTQFESLMKTSQAAKAQVEMLAKVAAGGAFSMDSLAEASQNLMVLTNGALGGEASLKKVQDAAAATGTPVQAMATAVANLNAALKNGAGVEQAAENLKQLGAISSATAQNVTALAASGASVSATWKSVESDLSKASGAASALGGTLSGLQQQLEAIKQQGNIDLGNMFAEGEKAGLRGAIGLEKFKVAIEKANAGPWSAFNAAINSVKEAIGGFLAQVAQTDAVQGAFSAMAKAAIGLLVGMAASLLAAIPLLLKLASVAGGAVVGGLTRMATAMGLNVTALTGMARALGSLAFNPLTVGLAIAATLFVDLAAKAIAAAQAVQAFQEKMSAAGSTRSSEMSDTLVETETARTPEQREEAKKNTKARLEASRSRVKENNKTIEESDNILNSTTLGVSDYSIPERNAADSKKRIAVDANQSEGMAQEVMQNQLSSLSERTVGFDIKRLELAQKRLQVEQQIAAQAQQALQRTLSPDAAKAQADRDSVKADNDLASAEAAQKTAFEDNVKLSTADKAFSEQQGGNQKYDDSVAEAAKMKKSIVAEAKNNSGAVKYGAMAEEAVKNNDIKSLQTLEDKGVISKGTTKKFEENSKTISGGRNIDYGVFDTGAKSESGKLQSEMAKREAMKAEETAALGATNSEGKAAPDYERVNAARAKMADLVNPLTGKSEFDGDEKMQDLRRQLAEAQASGDKGGVSGISSAIGNYASQRMGVSDQRMQTELQTATKKEDPAAARMAQEEVRIRQQAAAVAQAAAQQEIEASQKRLDVEKQIAALKKGGGSSQKSANQVEFEDRGVEINRKREALKKFEPAVQTYQDMLGSKQKEELPGDPNLDTPEQKQFRGDLESARKKFEAAQVGASAAGVNLGTDTQSGFDLQDKANAQSRDLANQAVDENDARTFGELNRSQGNAGRSRAGRSDSSMERGASEISASALRVQNINQAEVAATEYKKAEESGDVKGMNAASTKMAATGYGGMGLEEIKQIKAAENEILALKLQQAKVDEASAQARKQAAMDEVKFQQMRSQVTVGNALGNAKQGEFDIREKELTNEKVKADKAVPVAQEKESLTVEATALKAAAEAARAEARSKEASGDDEGAAVAKATANSLDVQAETTIARRDGLETELAGMGYGGMDSKDIEARAAKVNEDIKTNQVNRMATKQDSVENKQIKMAQIQEEYAPTQEKYKQASDDRKKLEDDKFEKEQKASYLAEGYTKDESDTLSASDRKMNRLKKDLDEAGTPQVDDLTRAGGNAAKVGLFPTQTQDKQAELQRLAQEQSTLLRQIANQGSEALRLSQADVRGDR